jgi:hypothetical protein
MAGHKEWLASWGAADSLNRRRKAFVNGCPF